MKLSALLIALLAVTVAVVPFVFNCRVEGRMMTLADGGRMPPRCYWTAQAELTLAVPLLALAGMLAFSRRKEARRALLVLGAILGVLVILLPARLIGVCADSGASCKLIMEPAIILAGSLLAGISLASLLLSERRSEYGDEPVRRRPLHAAARQRAGASIETGDAH